MVNIREGERASIVGKTGSGKTVLARYMLRGIRRLVVLDPKPALGKWGLEEWNSDTRKRLAEGEDVRVRVVLEAGADPRRFWEDVLREVYQAAYLTLYIDEGYGVVSGSQPGEWLQAVWTRGREFEITAIAATQRPRRIPLILLSEAEHFFVFRLLLEADREYMADIIGPDVAERMPDEHGFYYFHANQERPVYIPSVPPEFVRMGPPVTIEKTEEVPA